ncbi:hypothetical protein PCANB_000820 [Pneumocystis canis]|nr:hypothetical protein PCANB_000820 [Pneumocystis canis]
MDLILDTELFALRTHPSANVLVLGTLTGQVLSYQYKTDIWSYKEIWNAKRHRLSCRDLRYNMNGSKLVSVGADQTIKCACSETGRVEWKICDAHIVAINVVDYISETILATGDDNGSIKDKCIGDALFSVLDLRSSKSSLVLSENQEDDLLSSCFVKFQTNSLKICIGTASGAVKIFNKDKWDTYTDQILLSDKKNMLNINTMITWNNDIIIAGTSNGMIHILNIQPNRHMGIIGYQDSEVDVLAKTYDAEWILSGGNRKINAWKIDLDASNSKSREKYKDTSRQQLKKHKKNPMQNEHTSFFAGLT